MLPAISPEKLKLDKPVATYDGKGLTSRRPVTVNLYHAEPGTGVLFIVPKAGYDPNYDVNKAEKVVLRAHADQVISTVRNTALGADKTRICFVEHILCGLALCGIEDMYVEVLGSELPMGNGSADLWVDLLESHNLRKPIPDSSLELDEPIVIAQNGRSLIAYPSEKFSVTCLLELNHPKVGRIWKSWDVSEDIREVVDARTFGSLPEHQLLGFAKDVVSYTKDDFTMPLKTPDEPVRHKLLDLIGDLFLCGFNPLKIKASFVSIKGGHTIDVEMAKKLSTKYSKSN